MQVIPALCLSQQFGGGNSWGSWLTIGHVWSLKWRVCGNCVHVFLDIKFLCNLIMFSFSATCTCYHFFLTASYCIVCIFCFTLCVSFACSLYWPCWPYGNFMKLCLQHHPTVILLLVYRRLWQVVIMTTIHNSLHIHSVQPLLNHGLQQLSLQLISFVTIISISTVWNSFYPAIR